MNGFNSRTGLLLATALAPIAWGSTYVVATEMLPAERPLLAAAMRALPVGLLLVVIFRRLPRGSWWWRSFILGFLNIGIFFALLFVAAHRLPGGVAATAGAVQPLLVAFLAWSLLGERLSWGKVMAGLLGVAGVALLVLRAGAALDPVGILAALAGAVSMAAGVVLTKRWIGKLGRPASLFAFTAWQLVAGGTVLAVLALIVEGLPTRLTAVNGVGFIYLGVVGTALAYTIWFRGIEGLPASATSFLGLMSPVAASVLGFVVLGQTYTIQQGIGVVLVFVAVFLGQFSVRKEDSGGKDGKRANAVAIAPPTIKNRWVRPCDIAETSQPRWRKS
ncbi:MAG: EamA family transporter [Rubrobacteraceae bacterium]